tara:strand:- start:1523 stop:2620 length:1098 start_codon:yes stop_codon:yes gene_type:complete
MAKFDYQKDILEADQSLLDLMTKYPEVVTGVPEHLDRELKGLRREQRIKSEIPPSHPSWSWTDYTGENVRPMEDMESKIKYSINKAEKIKEKLKNPDISDNKRRDLERQLTMLARFTTTGRGGTAETRAEMAKMDTRTGTSEGKFKSGIEEEGGPKGKYTHQAVIEPEEEEVTLKGRLAELWADGSKRDAILGSISETLLETRFGKDAYGSRWRDLPKNVRAEMQEQEALNIVKDQAMLDMMKTQAETAASSNPMQYLSNTQKNARDHATAIGVKEGFVYGSKEWHTAYATALENMAMENLLTGPVEGIAAINELLVRNTGLFDEATMKVFKDVIAQLTSRITTDGGVKSTTSGKIYGGGTESGE